MSGTICFGGVCIPINAIWPVIVLGLKWLFEKIMGAPAALDVALDERPVVRDKIIFAHSMGNLAVGKALRDCTR